MSYSICITTPAALLATIICSSLLVDFRVSSETMSGSARRTRCPTYTVTGTLVLAGIFPAPSSELAGVGARGTASRYFRTAGAGGVEQHASPSRIPRMKLRAPGNRERLPNSCAIRPGRQSRRRWARTSSTKTVGQRAPLPRRERRRNTSTAEPGDRGKHWEIIGELCARRLTVVFFTAPGIFQVATTSQLLGRR